MIGWQDTLALCGIMFITMLTVYALAGVGCWAFAKFCDWLLD